MKAVIKCVQMENKVWAVVLNIENGETNNIELNFGFNTKESAMGNADLIMKRLRSPRINDAGRRGLKAHAGRAVVDVSTNFNGVYVLQLFFLDERGNTIKRRTLSTNAGDKEAAMKLAAEYKEAFEVASVETGGTSI